MSAPKSYTRPHIISLALGAVRHDAQVHTAQRSVSSRPRWTRCAGRVSFLVLMLGFETGLPKSGAAAVSRPLPQVQASQGKVAETDTSAETEAIELTLEQALLEDMVRCLRGEKPSDTWRNPRLVDGHLKTNGRSANHGRMARAVQTCAAPEEKAGASSLTALQWWAKIEEMERGPVGHRYQELGGGYEGWSSLSEAFVVWRTGDLDHPAAKMLKRELLLFAVAARPIDHHPRWRPLYRGYGRRVAGLRKLPWAWSFGADSYLFARILGLPVQLDRLERTREMLILDGVAPKLAQLFEKDARFLRALVLEPQGGAAGLIELRRRSQDVRAIQPYLLVRQIGTDATFSALLGPLSGRNTAPTRAILTLGPLMADARISYPFRDGKGEPRRRVRGGGELLDGGGELFALGNGTKFYRSWNEPPITRDSAHAKSGVRSSVETMQVPGWVPTRPGETPCGTLGLWLFPDREPVAWIEPPCS